MRVFTYFICGLIYFSIARYNFVVDAYADDNTVNKKHGFVQLNYSYATLNSGFPNWQDISLRGYIELTPKEHIDLSVERQEHFDDTGVLYGLRFVKIFNSSFYGSVNFNSSEGGFFLPKNRFDLEFNSKWLKRKNLVTSIAFMRYRAKDVHQDSAIKIGAMYYFVFPIVIEVGLHRNESNPGSVVAWRQRVSLMYGYNKKYYYSLSHNYGYESYQLVGIDKVVSRFRSQETLFTWRQWLGANSGVETTLNYYSNSNYHRKGVRLGLFHDF